MKAPLWLRRRPTLAVCLLAVLTAAPALGQPPPDVVAPARQGPPVALADDATAPAAPSAATDAAPPAADPSAAPEEADDLEFAEAMQDLDDEASSLQMYGFADFTFSAFLMDKDSSWFDSFFSQYPTFAVGNINLYLSKRLAPKWTSLIELRLLYLPNGSETIGEDGKVSRTDTNVLDPQDKAEFLDWGGIHIERVYVEYEFDPLLKVRAGQWLTPYGIWNFDHGSPVLIGIRRPFVIGYHLFPTSQTGLDLNGSHTFGDKTVGYHVTLSNGRGPIDTYQDLDYNKAVGGRLSLETSWLDEFKLGVSGYTGTYTSLSRSYGSRNDQVTAESEVLEQYREVSLAADARIAVGRFVGHAEIVSRQIVYNDKARVPFRFGAGGEDPDYFTWGGYGLVGYRLPWADLMPYAYVEYFKFGLETLPTAVVGTVGVNLRPSAAVTLKLQFLTAGLPGSTHPIVRDEPLTLLETQAAWAF